MMLAQQTRRAARAFSSKMPVIGACQVRAPCDGARARALSRGAAGPGPHAQTPSLTLRAPPPAQVPGDSRVKTVTVLPGAGCVASFPRAREPRRPRRA
jgi:hypothetical protein